MDASPGVYGAAHPDWPAVDQCVMGNTAGGRVTDSRDRGRARIAYVSRSAGIYPPLPRGYFLLASHLGFPFLVAGTALLELVLYAVHHPRRYSDPGGSSTPL